MDAIITSENIFRSSSVGTIIFNCVSLIKDFYGSSRISPIVKGLNSLHCGLLSDSPQKETFQKVEREMSYFPYIVRKSEKLPLVR